ncbi:MAG: hypothetical protein LBV75_03575 [Paludibacter sp.]|jgi:hypothetical protein|nr:hypothetical protein [Paludibacter sp.]
MKNLKQIRFYACILTIIIAFGACNNVKTKALVISINKDLPISSNGVTVQNAEALDHNVIKLNCLITDPIFETMDSVYLEMAISAMKTSMIDALRSQENTFNLIKDVKSDLLYEFTLNDGKQFQINISADELAAYDIIQTKENRSEKAILIERIINSLKPQLPVVVSEVDNIILTDIYAQGDSVLAYQYQVEEENLYSTDPEILKAALLISIRVNQSITGILAQGIDLKYVYISPEGAELVQLTITQSDI